MALQQPICKLSVAAAGAGPADAPHMAGARPAGPAVTAVPALLAPALPRSVVAHPPAATAGRASSGRNLLRCPGPPSLQTSRRCMSGLLAASPTGRLMAACSTGQPGWSRGLQIGCSTVDAMRKAKACRRSSCAEAPCGPDPVFMPVAAPAAAPAARAAWVPDNRPNWHNRSYRSNHPPTPECFAGPSEGFQPRPSPWWEPLHVGSFADAPPETPRRMNCGWSPRDGADDWRSWPDPQHIMSDIRSHMPEMASVMRDINAAVAHMQQQTDQAGHQQDHARPQMDQARRQTDFAGSQTDWVERHAPRQQRLGPSHAARQDLGQRHGEGCAVHEEPLPSPQEPVSRGRRRGRSGGRGRGQNRFGGCTVDNPNLQAVRHIGPNNRDGRLRRRNEPPPRSSEDAALAGLDVGHCMSS